MGLMQKVGIIWNYWDAKEAPAITFIFRAILILIVAAIGYGLWRLFD